MNRLAFVPLAATALSLLFAFTPGCSSDESTEGSKTPSADSGSGPATSDGGTGTGDAASCTCDITFNGVEQVLTCGQTACVNEEQFACSSASGGVDEGACTSGGGMDGGADAAPQDAAPPMCLALEASCDYPDDCCSGTFCDEGGDVCVEDFGGPCTSTSQCESPDPPVITGGSCVSGICCANTNNPCAVAGPDPSCCSGTCSAPNRSGISFCD